MTLEEMERRAYADGDVKAAALYAHAIDGDEDLQDHVAWLEDENARLTREVDDLTYELREVA